MRILLQQLGNPHLAVPTIHVAGTNGKGSTAAMIASILERAGLRVGLFTSPHLHAMVERIRLGLTPIGRAQFASLFAQVWPAAQAVAHHPAFSGPGGQVTTLELLTAMALHHFREAGAAYQVVEAFVGGRDDITNIVQPVLSVITNISRDHIPALGTTLLDIARAKAGIIKPGCRSWWRRRFRRCTPCWRAPRSGRAPASTGLHTSQPRVPATRWRSRTRNCTGVDATTHTGRHWRCAAPPSARTRAWRLSLPNG